MKKLFYVVFILFIISCGQKENDEKIRVWIPGDRQEYGFYFDMFENYKRYKEQAGETFDYVIEQQPWSDYWTKLPLEIHSGRGPDLFLSHVAYVEILIPLAKALSLSEDVLSKFKVTDLYLDEEVLPVFIPTVFVSKVLYANTDIVANWEDYPKTWEELATAAQKYTDVEKGIIGFDYSFHLLWDLAYQNGERLTNDNGVEFSTTALKTLLQWTEEKWVDYLSFGRGGTEDSLYEGTAAYVYGEPWMEFWASDEVKKRIKAFPIPSGLTHHSAELSFGINKNVSDERYAVLNDFIRFMLTDEKTIRAIVKGNSGVPNNKEIEIVYEPFSAGHAVQTTFKNNNSKFSVPPRALELVYKTMLENTLNGTSVRITTDEAYTNSDGIDVSRLRIMETLF